MSAIWVDWSGQQLVSGVGQCEVAFEVSDSSGGTYLCAADDTGDGGSSKEEQPDAAGLVEYLHF